MATTEKKREPKPKPPSDRQYRNAEIALALSWAPTIYPCRSCKWPVLAGYCCTTCGSTNPSGSSRYYE